MVFSNIGDGGEVSAQQQALRPRILLVDDDVTFGKIMKKMASKLDLPLHYVSSANELIHLPKDNFDVGIFDYDLGTITGVQLSDIVEKYIGKIPVLLVSSYGRIENRKWPGLVQGFIPKSQGFHAILAEACKMHEDNLGKQTEDVSLN